MFYELWTKDWHPENHCSFIKNGGMWLAHCIQETSGSALHSNLEVKKNEYVVTKGTNSKYDSYSAFKDDGGSDTGLTSLLRCHLPTAKAVGLNSESFRKASSMLSSLYDSLRVG